MNEELNVNSIKEFWKWFASICEDFGEDFDNYDLIDDLDRRISSLGDFTWELGPGINSSNMLVISPGGELSLLEKTKKIISYSLKCKGWEFFYAKPPKDWDLIFDFYRDSEEHIEVNANTWEYVLLKYDDGMFEILIKCENVDSRLSIDERQIACEILLDGILGEELRILRFEIIEVVDSFERKYQNKVLNIKSLSSRSVSV